MDSPDNPASLDVLSVAGAGTPTTVPGNPECAPTQLIGLTQSTQLDDESDVPDLYIIVMLGSLHMEWCLTLNTGPKPTKPKSYITPAGHCRWVGA